VVLAKKLPQMLSQKDAVIPKAPKNNRRTIEKRNF